MDNTHTSLDVDAPHPTIATMPRDAAAVPVGSGDQSSTCATTAAPNRIMSLPPEVRIMLFRAVFDIDRIPTFASVSKEIRSEALPVFYEHFCLEIQIGPPGLWNRRLYPKIERVRSTPEDYELCLIRATLCTHKTENKAYSKRWSTKTLFAIDWKDLRVNNIYLQLWKGGPIHLFDYLRKVKIVVWNTTPKGMCEVHLCFRHDPTVEIKPFEEEANGEHHLSKLRVMLETELSLWNTGQEQLRFSRRLYDALARHIHHYQMSVW